MNASLSSLSQWLMRLFIWIAAVLLTADYAVTDEHEIAGRAGQLLRAKCISCHGAESAEGDLRLDTRSAMLKGGQSGPAAVPGKADESLLYQCVIGSKGDELRMPPKNPLSAAEIDLLREWLKRGAIWKDAESAPMKSTEVGEVIGDAWSDPRNPIVKIFGGQRLDLWSLQPMRPVHIDESVVLSHSRDWIRNEIDWFVAAQYAKVGRNLPKSADRHTLLRRIHFDLTGLPPAPETVTWFNESMDAGDVEGTINQLFDRLLSSSQFGIHWARMWLDVARYSDSNGYDWDEFRPQAYRYRDYVVRSFNQDKAYDRFVLEQLAGDEMFDGPPVDQQQQDALIATGFLRMGPHDNAAKLFNEQDRSRDELLIDLVETTGGAMLGMTLGCCRCHDHKFDPVSQADYFRLRACFAGVQFADDLPIDLAETQAEAAEHNAVIDERLAKLNSENDELIDSIRARVLAERTAAGKPGEQTEVSKKPDEVKKLANEEEKQRLKDLSETIRRVTAEKRPLTHAMLMVDQEQPSETFVLYQGDYKSPRQPVEPGIFSILNPNQLPPARVPRNKTSGRRTALVQWITSPSNPLTARVIVNRVWQQLMGQGLVRTPGDFGLAGIAPEDPALLDWLASRFVEDGWSIKRLVREIMQSSTYQQSPSFEEPPESLVYATRRPRRLTAEQLRDSMLVVSGLLTSKSSGPPEWPDLPREVLEANPAFLDDNETKTKGWYPSPLDQQYCRSIFLVQKRNTRVPLLETLDQPENSVPCPRRLSSIVAPQALSLLNSPEALAAAKGFASRLDSFGSSTAKIERAFLLALQRKPTNSELLACQKLVECNQIVELCRVLLNVNEFAFVD